MPDVASPSSDAVIATAKKLAALERASQLDLDINGGRIVITDCFSGSLEAWNKRNSGDQTLAALAVALELRDATWTESRLYRAVRFFEQWTVLGDFKEWPQLMPSHFVRVQGLPWDRQRELLTKANAEGWTVATLTASVGPRNPEAAAAAPAPAKDALRALKVLERALGLRDHLLEDLADAGQPTESSDRLLKAIDAAKSEIERVRLELAPKAPAKAGKKTATG